MVWTTENIGMDSVYALWTQHEILGSKSAFIFKIEGGKRERFLKYMIFLIPNNSAIRISYQNAWITRSSWLLISLRKFQYDTGAEEKGRVFDCYCCFSEVWKH